MSASCPKLFEIYIVKLLCSFSGVEWKKREVVDWRGGLEGKKGQIVEESVASIDWVHKYTKYIKGLPPTFEKMEQDVIYYSMNPTYVAVDAVVKTSNISIDFFQMKRLRRTAPCKVDGIPFSFIRFFYD